MCLEIKNIKTKRLLLRNWQMTDLEDLYKFASVPGVGEGAGWEHHKTLEDSKEFLEMLIRFKTVFCIELDGRAIGSFDFSWDKYKKDFISIGYSMAKDCWGNGYMTEAANAILNYFRENYGVHKFCARTFPNNFRSQKLLERLGFKFVSSDDEENYYELLK